MILLNKLLIGKGPPSTVGDVHELFGFIREAFLRIVNYMSQKQHGKLHDFGGTKDTGDRTWDLPHQRADPHQLSYTCNFPLVLFLFPPLSNGKWFY